jgi:hypothetical protein
MDKSPEHSHIEHLVKTKLPNSPIYNFLLAPVRITHASKGHVLARLTLSQNHMNAGQSLHGSVSATIVDWAGGMAISTWDLREKSGRRQLGFHQSEHFQDRGWQEGQHRGVGHSHEVCGGHCAGLILSCGTTRVRLNTCKTKPYLLCVWHGIMHFE